MEECQYNLNFPNVYECSRSSSKEIRIITLFFKYKGWCTTELCADKWYTYVHRRSFFV